MIFDAHLDLAMNALEWNRDLTQSIAVIRAHEAHLRDKPDRGNGTVCLPELRRGGIGMCVATQIARVEHHAYSPVFGWASPAQAWAQTQGQLAWYRAMEAAGELVQIRDRAGLDRHLALWTEKNGRGRATDRLPVGYVLSLEGADSLITLNHLETAFQQGLRALGPAHYGPGAYANGTGATGGLTDRGRDLLKEMDRLGLILDVTHLCDDCFWEALDDYSGCVWASHSNCRALNPDPRQLSDEQIRALVQRDAVIGAALDAWMLVPNWQRGVTIPEQAGLTLEKVAEHIDHLCQIAGDARHVGIGSDLDGAFGREQTPQDLDTIADLQKLGELLLRRGFTKEQVAGVMGGNFVRLLRHALGE